MSNHAITAFGNGTVPEILVSETTIASSAEQIKAVIGEVPSGTIIYTAGFGTIKQKGLDGSWVEVQ